MSPILGVPLLLLYFAAITYAPIEAGVFLATRTGIRSYAGLGAVITLILWGITIGLLMSADPNFGKY